MRFSLPRQPKAKVAADAGLGSLLIVTNDRALMEILGGKFRQWGAKVLQHDPEVGQASLGKSVDVILVDVRHHAEKMLAALREISEATIFTEIVLINSSDNVNASMAGMRAGASDELTVPFDMGTLKKKVGEACRRSRIKQLAGKKRRSLFTVFEDAMSAAAFAQAGEFETALSMLHPPDAENGEDGHGGKDEDGFNHGNARRR